MSSSPPGGGTDDTKREQRQRRMRRVQVGMAAFAAFWGMLAFYGVATNPRFENYHTLDVIRLMTAGGCLGAALVVLVQFFALPGPRSETKKY